MCYHHRRHVRPRGRSSPVIGRKIRGQFLISAQRRCDHTRCACSSSSTKNRRNAQACAAVRQQPLPRRRRDGEVCPVDQFGIVSIVFFLRFAVMPPSAVGSNKRQRACRRRLGQHSAAGGVPAGTPPAPPTGVRSGRVLWGFISPDLQRLRRRFPPANSFHSLISSQPDALQGPDLGGASPLGRRLPTLVLTFLRERAHHRPTQGV